MEQDVTGAYQLPAALRAFADQIPAEHLREFERAGRENGWSQADFAAVVVEAFGDPAAQLAELERAFGKDTAATMRAVHVFSGELGRHHSAAVERLGATAAGVRFLNDLRVGGAAGLDLAKHGSAVAMLRSDAAGAALLTAVQGAQDGIAMPGVPAAPKPAPATTERPPIGKSAEELGSLMKDPRYWRDKDPAFVADVTRGFQELYPGEVETAPIAPTSARA